MKRFGYLLVMILLPVSVSVAGDSLQSVKSITDLSVFTERYYLEPCPDLVDEAIEFIGNNNVLMRGNAAPMTVAFFAEVFSSNKDRLPKWQEVIQRQPDEVRPLFLRALSMSVNPKRVLEEPPSDRLNDICWGGFLASGDSTYLKILLSQLDHIDERTNLNLYTTAATAKWSLASNALRHRAVKDFIQAARKDAAVPLRRELKEILKRSPGDIQADMVTVLRELRRTSAFEANAIWVKGQPDLETLRRLDPKKEIQEFSVKNGEQVSLYVAYRSPARNKDKWAKVSFRLSMSKPNGELDNLDIDPEDIIAGEGEIFDEEFGRWAVSHGRVAVEFSDEDPRGVYSFRVTIKDHVGDTEIIKMTRVLLE